MGAYIPADIAPHTVESLYAEQGPTRPWTYWLVLAGVIGALASLPLVKVDVSVRAPGLVRPLTKRADLSTPVARHNIANNFIGNHANETTKPKTKNAMKEDHVVTRKRSILIALFITLLGLTILPGFSCTARENADGSKEIIVQG